MSKAHIRTQPLWGAHSATMSSPSPWVRLSTPGHQLPVHPTSPVLGSEPRSSTQPPLAQSTPAIILPSAPNA